jgi:hypothetical protein
MFKIFFGFEILLTSFMCWASNSNVNSSEDFRSLQRYRFVAFANDGRKVAILLSHFGPSSQAPFVNLIVKEVGNSTVEKIDSEFVFQGGEQTLKNLETYVLKHNFEKLQQRGFVFSSDVFKELPSFWEGPAPTVGYIDTQDDSGLTEFTISKLPLTCPDLSPGFDWTICTNNGRCTEAKDDATTACLTTLVVPQRVLRVGKILWVVGYRKMKVLDPVVATLAEFAGIE